LLKFLKSSIAHHTVLHCRPNSGMIDRAGNTLYSNTVNPPLTQISGTDNHTKFKKKS